MSELTIGETKVAEAAPGKARKTRKLKPAVRFGVAEWFGESFEGLPPQRRVELIQLAKTNRRGRNTLCPFHPEQESLRCRKQTGVCTLRQYVRAAEGDVQISQGKEGRLATLCPERFFQGGEIFRWIGEKLLNCATPEILNEIPFLEGVATENKPGEESDSVGRIDNVLVVPDSDPLRWCAVEMQAVYHQGGAYSKDYPAMESALANGAIGIPFPGAYRQPDYRSSGPKRLMPQLQVKVPSLRRWGKKMAVVIDEAFFGSLALKETQRQEIKSISNSDVVWFVVGYEEKPPHKLYRKEVFLTTLENAVEGLTAGVPTSLEEFEKRIKAKLPQENPAVPLFPIEAPP
ncbi:MAG: hypothetical protein JWQ87_5527 [Candidatus Sulfotelmatobacter sp.]|nr:hypothetical protein [Candidatus Sulfotelmatobacter sp.]